MNIGKRPWSPHSCISGHLPNQIVRTPICARASGPHCEFCPTWIQLKMQMERITGLWQNAEFYQRLRNTTSECRKQKLPFGISPSVSPFPSGTSSFFSFGVVLWYSMRSTFFRSLLPVTTVGRSSQAVFSAQKKRSIVMTCEPPTGVVARNFLVAGDKWQKHGNTRSFTFTCFILIARVLDFGLNLFGLLWSFAFGWTCTWLVVFHRLVVLFFAFCALVMFVIRIMVSSSTFVRFFFLLAVNLHVFFLLQNSFMISETHQQITIFPVLSRLDSNMFGAPATVHGSWNRQSLVPSSEIAQCCVNSGHSGFWFWFWTGKLSCRFELSEKAWLNRGMICGGIAERPDVHKEIRSKFKE